MANVNAPFGFKPVGAATGMSPTWALQPFLIKSTYGTKICTGDGCLLLTSVSPGYIQLAAASTAVSQWAGIFMGCKYYSTAQGRTVESSYWPGSDATGDVTAFLIPMAGTAPQDFFVQALLTPITQASVGRNIDISVGTQTVSGVFGKSGMTVDSGTLGSTATLPFTVLDTYANYAPSTSVNGADVTTNYNIIKVRANTLSATGY